MTNIPDRAPLAGVLICSSVHQAFDGPGSLLFSCRCWSVGRETMLMTPSPMRNSAAPTCFHGCPLSSSTGISHHNLLPHMPPVSLSAVNSSPHPGIAPQSLNSGSQLLCLPASFSRVCVVVARTVGFSFHLGCLRSAVSLSALNVSPLAQLPHVGIGPLLQFPHLLRPTNTPAFPPSSFIVPSFVWLYILFSAGQVLLSALS